MGMPYLGGGESTTHINYEYFVIMITKLKHVVFIELRNSSHCYFCCCVLYGGIQG